MTQVGVRCICLYCGVQIYNDKCDNCGAPAWKSLKFYQEKSKKENIEIAKADALRKKIASHWTRKPIIIVGSTISFMVGFVATIGAVFTSPINGSTFGTLILSLGMMIPLTYIVWKRWIQVG